MICRKILCRSALDCSRQCRAISSFCPSSSKIEALATTPKDKSAFLATRTHDLRTPPTSILVLGQQLGANPDRNLAANQVEFAPTIHDAGTDLLNLISDILDLSKSESETVS